MKYRWECNLCEEHSVNGGMARGMSKNWNPRWQASKSLRIHSETKHNGKVDGLLIREDGIKREVKKI